MQQQSAQHLRKRSQTIPNPHDDLAKGKNGSRSSPPPPLLTSQSTRGAAGVGGFAGQSYQNGLVGGHVQAATTAANVAFPRSPGVAVSAISFEQLPEREQKQKGEKSKMKLFSSKPKHIGISRDKDGSGKEKGLPSPNKLGFGSSSGLSRIVSASTTSLVDSASLNSPSMYSLSNASASTVVPADRHTGSEREKDREKDKDRERDKDKVHKPHFLSRQKLKLKDDHYNLPLSSASSNSKPLDPSAPQSLYSFTPSSPGPSSTTFGKSVTGLDLLHGGRALREKKKEEKAFAAASLDLSRESDPVDWLANVVGAGGGQSTFHGPSSYGSSAGFLYGDSALRETLQGFGLNNMTPEDVWDFLKAKLLVIFDGEDVRIAIEDLNKLVLIHIQRCVQKHMPSVIVEDLRDLLETGFASLNHSISGVPDEKLVPHLVQIWMLVFGTILPFIQAVFLPLDLEFKGRGSVMNAREAREFWGALPHADSSDASMGDELDVRTIVLVAFRDRVILNRYESLKSTFSRLSLDSINASLGTLNATPNSNSSGGRPGTATSLDTGYSSFNSQSSTLLNTVGNSSDSASASRSRATSNTSNPDQLIFQSFSSPPQRPTYANRSTQPTDCSHVITETVGRMLQCVSVLASVHTSDEPQERIEVLNKALKHNWLGRGRTGRDRRGFVGTRIRSAATPHQDGYRSVNDQINRDVASNWPNGNSNLSML
jgi:HbrB-like